MQKISILLCILHWNLLQRSEWCIYLWRNQTLIGRCLTYLTLTRKNRMVVIVEFRRMQTPCFHGAFQIGMKATEQDIDQFLKAMWKVSLITLYEKKYICELVELMFSLWGNSLPRLCFWFRIYFADTCLSTPTTGLHPRIVTTFSTCNQLLWDRYSAVYFAPLWMNSPSNWLWMVYFLSGWNFIESENFTLWIFFFFFEIWNWIMVRAQCDPLWEMDLWNRSGKIYLWLLRLL